MDQPGHVTEVTSMLAHKSINIATMQALCQEAQEESIPFWKLIMIRDCEEQLISEEQSFENMKKLYNAMKASNAAAIALKGLLGLACDPVADISSF